MGDPTPRRRRRMRREPGGDAETWLGAQTPTPPDADPGPPPLADPGALTSPIQDPSPPGWTEPAAVAPEPGPQDDREVERGLRGLVGGGSSQVSIGAALRARDATRPTERDMAAAEAELVIIRRGWTPPPG